MICIYLAHLSRSLTKALCFIVHAKGHTCYGPNTFLHFVLMGQQKENALAASSRSRKNTWTCNDSKDLERHFQCSLDMRCYFWSEIHGECHFTNEIVCIIVKDQVLPHSWILLGIGFGTNFNTCTFQHQLTKMVTSQLTSDSIYKVRLVWKQQLQTAKTEQRCPSWESNTSWLTQATVHLP